MNEPELPRREQLLVDAAMSWLDRDDEVAADELLRGEAAQREFAALERAASLVTLASMPRPQPAAPQTDVVDLTAKLQAAAFAWFAARDRQLRPAPQSTAAPRGRPQALPWLLLAASLVVLLWRGGPGAMPAPAVAREALLSSATATLQCAWQPGPSALRGDVHGDVVWNEQRQEGYLRLAGLPPLDATKCYQLWIVDATREGPPVDGGLFAIPAASGEAVVPVDARLPVGKAAAFVLTVESDRGVVVSGQQEVVAIARP